MTLKKSEFQSENQHLILPDLAGTLSNRNTELKKVKINPKNPLPLNS